MTSQALMEALGDFWEAQEYASEQATITVPLPSIKHDEFAPLEKKIGHLQAFIRELQLMLQHPETSSESRAKTWEEPVTARASQYELKVNLQKLLDQRHESLDLTEKLFVGEFLKGLEREADTFFYLNQFFTVMERFKRWDRALTDIHRQLETMATLSKEMDDAQKLYRHLDSFEKELIDFHRQFGESITSLFHYPLTEIQQAIKIGHFRKRFQSINDAYGKLKSVLMNTQVDAHFCCMCHFSDHISQNWPINNKIFDIHEGSAYCQVGNRKQSEPSLLIFTCGGGYGHLSAAKAMAQSAFGKYHILVASTLEETLASNDILKKFKLNFSQEKLYNYLLKNDEFEWIKLMTSLGSPFFMLQHKKVERLIRIEVLKQKPDLLISCIPVFNPMFLNIAKELNLPLLIVTTDLDTGEFTKGMTHTFCDLDYARYRVTLAYENPSMRTILENRIPKEKIHVSGFPLRNAFNWEIPEHSLDAVRRKYHIRKDEKLILIMMGGNAGFAIEKYAKFLAAIEEEEMDEKLHVLCLCGDQAVAANREMRARINALNPQSSRIAIDAVPATFEIAELMSLADVLITKPGGCTTNEAIAKKVPLIFHSPFALMSWEKFNMKFCIEAQMGSSFKIKAYSSKLSKGQVLYNKNRLLPLLKQALERRKALKNSPHPIDRKDFSREFLGLVEDLLSSK